MLCFAPLKREVGIAPNTPSPEWEMKLLPIEEIKPATAPSAAEATPPPAATATAAAPAPANGKNAKKAKGAPAAPASPAQSGFQRADVNASAGAAATPKDANDAGAAGQGNVNEANPAPSDGFLINGSVNNGAASPFAQAAAFGNNRRNGRSLYNGNVGFIVGNSALDARSIFAHRPGHTQAGLQPRAGPGILRRPAANPLAGESRTARTSRSTTVDARTATPTRRPA